MGFKIDCNFVGKVSKVFSKTVDTFLQLFLSVQHLISKRNGRNNLYNNYKNSSFKFTNCDEKS